LVELKESESEDSTEEAIKEEIELHLHWWLPAFYVIYFCSYLIPGIIFMTYIMLFYLPYLLEVKLFTSIFTSLPSLIAVLTLPFLIIICYLIHLIIVALVTRLFWVFSEKRSPSKSGVIPRNIPSKTRNYYHFRSFIIKYPKNVFSRGPFPWLLKWMFNFVGTNKIGKNTVIEEQVAGDRFVDIGENSYLGTNSIISSHAVEGIFGNISFAKVKIGNNTTLSGFGVVGPGSDTGDNAWFLPMTAAAKYNIMKGNGFYFGIPLRKIFKRKVMDFLQIAEEDLRRAEELEIKLSQSKTNKKKKKTDQNDT
jgi:energy-coupling factor transporter transmembrane protein EcfT